MEVIIDITLKRGVLDSAGKAVHHTLDTIGFEKIVKDVRIGKQIVIQLDTTNEDEAKKSATKMCEELLVNTVIEEYTITLKN